MKNKNTDKGVIYTNTAIGFEKLNPHILESQVDELKMIFGIDSERKAKGMKRSEAILRISEKLQKQMHIITSRKMIDNPKMLCDNLAMRVMTEIEEIGMLPPKCPDSDEY